MNMKQKFLYFLIFINVSVIAFADGALDVKRDTFGPCDQVFYSLIKFTYESVMRSHPYTINSDGDKVIFAPGNLQYQASTKSWRFARRQWMIVGGPETDYDVYYDSIGLSGDIHTVRCNNALNSKKYGGWIDLFAWGTSGCKVDTTVDKYIRYTQPYDGYTGTISADHNTYGFGPSFGVTGINADFSVGSNSTKYDWGTNGIYCVYPYYLDATGVHHEGATNDVVHTSSIAYDSTFYSPNVWRTLTRAEWTYVSQTRKVEGNKDAWCRVQLCYDSLDDTKTRLGVILMPDDFERGALGLTDADLKYGETTPMKVVYKVWHKLDSVGCVFLPAAGYFNTQDNRIQAVNQTCSYWTCTANNASTAYVSDGVNVTNDGNRSYRYPVRLAQDIERE